jgi:hypothetical protein
MHLRLAIYWSFLFLFNRYSWLLPLKKKYSWLFITWFSWFHFYFISVRFFTIFFSSLLFYTFIFFDRICVVNLFKVRNLSGEWISAPPVPGTFVCNIGDMLKVYFTWILLEIWWSFNWVWKMHNCRYTPTDCMSQLCIVW